MPSETIPGASAETLARAAELFKVLGAPARLAILRELAEPRSVNELVEATGLSQPLVSQHLRILRGARAVSVTREGRTATYELVDRHIGHVIDDAISHVDEIPG